METYQKQPLHLKFLLEQRLAELQTRQQALRKNAQQIELIYFVLQHFSLQEPITLFVLLPLIAKN
jgi:hypothetical protein